MQPVVHLQNLGSKPYYETWRYQQSLQQELIRRKRERNNDDSAGYLLFVEHPNVYTIGKSGKWENLIFTNDTLVQKGIGVVKTDRGGDITFHGPGQIVVYPVLDLEQFRVGVARYIEKLEEVIIRTAAGFGIIAQRIPSRTGVWVDNNKLCALGIKCSRFVCMHGFALNAYTDLDFFHGIIPCGIDDGGVTSFEKLLENPPPADVIRNRIVIEFEEVFGCSITPMPADS